MDAQDMSLGMAIVFGAPFMGQPNEASQQAYAIRFATTLIFDGRARTHLLDWGSPNTHRKMTSSRACDSSSAASVVDRGSVARTMAYDVDI